MKYRFLFLSLISSTVIFMSCQQEINDNSVNPATQKPKLGSRWIYRYSTYNSQGGFIGSMDVVYKAVSQELLGGENWLKIIDSASGSTVFYLNEKADGLYQYIGNGSNLFCKYPAAVGENYRSLLSGTDSVTYFVRSLNDTLAFGVIGDVVVNYYEGMAGSETADKLWYNSKMWLAQRFIYRKYILGGYYKNASLILQDFTY